MPARCKRCGFACDAENVRGDFRRCPQWQPRSVGEAVAEPLVLDHLAEAGPLVVLLYYSYVDIDNVKAALRWHRLLGEHLCLRGRIRVSPEGLNVILDGDPADVDFYCQAVRCSGNFGDDVDFKVSEAPAGYKRFPKLSCRPTSHVVELGVDGEHVRPGRGARHLSPLEWHQMLAEGGSEDTVLLDTRNVYESRIGRFEGHGVETIEVNTQHFAQFPEFVDRNLERLSGKRVMMYCTGGVRCETASSYLLSKVAAAEVVQLKGGICRYLEQFRDRPQEGFFRGKNFVFDSRRYEPTHDGCVTGRCDGCGSPWDDYDNGPEARCQTCRVLMLLCDACRASREAATAPAALLCGGAACSGERIRCSCGCSAECSAGPICRRTGFFTLRADAREGAAAAPPRRRPRGEPPREGLGGAGASAHAGGRGGSAADGDAADGVAPPPATAGGGRGDTAGARGDGGAAAFGRGLGRLPQGGRWTSGPCGGCIAAPLRRLAAAWRPRRGPPGPGPGRSAVRAAVLEDAEACFALVNEAYREQYGGARYRDLEALRCAIRQQRVLVTCGQEGQVLGCAGHELVGDAAGGVLRLGPVAVAPRQQGCGLGTALLGGAEAVAAGCGCTAVEVEVRRGAGQTQRLTGFYRRRGFETSGPRDRNYVALRKQL